MPRKKKVEEEAIEEAQQYQGFDPPQEPIDDRQIRLQMLGLSKEILEHRSHLRWETHKEVIDVDIEDVIKGAKKLLSFVNG